MNTNQIPPGIKVFKAGGNIVTCAGKYEDWVTLNLSVSHQIITISVDGKQWSVGDRLTHEFLPKEDSGIIKSFIWNWRDTGAWFAIHSDSEIYSRLDCVTKLPVKDSGGEEIIPDKDFTQYGLGIKHPTLQDSGGEEFRPMGIGNPIEPNNAIELINKLRPHLDPTSWNNNIKAMHKICSDYLMYHPTPINPSEPEERKWSDKDIELIGSEEIRFPKTHQPYYFKDGFWYGDGSRRTTEQFMTYIKLKTSNP